MSGKCFAVDSCEQVAEAARIVDMPGMLAGVVIINMARLLLVHMIKEIIGISEKMANTNLPRLKH